MTPVMLLKSLAAELREATKQFKFVAQYQEPKKVSIYVQAIPTAEFENSSFYPLICVELLNIEDTNEDSTVSVLLTFGTYSGETLDGWLDHLNLVSEVRQYLLQNRLIGDQFLLSLPAYFGIVEPRSDNFIFSNYFLQYQIEQPTMGIPY